MSDATSEIGILARRRIEAEIIKPIYDILVRDFGEEKARAVVAEAVTKSAVDAGRSLAARETGGACLSTFIALQPLWEKDDALRIEVLRRDAETYEYDVTRCRYAEMYRDLGVGDIGFLLSCNRDKAFIEGYAPEIELTRTTTLMEGAPRCDFRYQVRK